MAMTLLNQGELASRTGDRSSAQLKIQEALTLAKELRDGSDDPRRDELARQDAAVRR